MKIIADCCNNHDGSMSKIRLMISQLAELGIDYAKFQVYSSYKLNPDYPDHDTMKGIYQKCELSILGVGEIIAFCKEHGIKPLFTLFDVDKAYWLELLDIKEVKIASPDCCNWKLLDRCFKSFDKLFISTGMHTIKEIETMLERYKKYHKKIVLLYCKSQYPAIYSDADCEKSREIIRLSKEYKLQAYGVSDHGEKTKDTMDCLEDVIEYYEHHFTLEKTGKTDDLVSWTIEEFAGFLGIGEELENRKKYLKRWI